MLVCWFVCLFVCLFVCFYKESAICMNLGKVHRHYLAVTLTCLLKKQLCRTNILFMVPVEKGLSRLLP